MKKLFKIAGFILSALIKSSPPAIIFAIVQLNDFGFWLGIGFIIISYFALEVLDRALNKFWPENESVKEPEEKVITEPEETKQYLFLCLDNNDFYNTEMVKFIVGEQHLNLAIETVINDDCITEAKYILYKNGSVVREKQREFKAKGRAILNYQS